MHLIHSIAIGSQFYHYNNKNTKENIKTQSIVMVECLVYNKPNPLI
jgi:hypothetical protein